MSVVCQPHNLRRPISQVPKPYGVRVSLRPGDPFRKIMGANGIGRTGSRPAPSATRRWPT